MSTCAPLDHGQPTLPIHVDSSNNQGQLESDLCKHSVLHYASSNYSNAETQNTNFMDTLFSCIITMKKLQQETKKTLKETYRQNRIT